MNTSRVQSRQLIWDLPVRVLHAAFAGGLAVALLLGFAVEEEHPLFAWHVLAGMFAAGALVLRVLWGIVGPGQARFTRWPLAPAALLRQLAGLWPGRPPEVHAGHNPLAAWVMLGMLAIAGAVIATGFASGDDLHEGLAAVLAGAIGLHLAGLVLHRLRAGENLAPAMLDGRKIAPPAAALARPYALAGLTTMLLLGLWAGVLVRAYDPQAGAIRLPFGLPAVDLRHGGDGDHAAGRHHDDDED